MLGRGIDQILPHPSDPRLWEPGMISAAGYVALAEAANGPIPTRVDPAYVWGDVLDVLDRRRPDARIVNLETAVTTRADPEPKGINYRMNPANAGVLVAAGVDACALANNHVLDWGVEGLVETLEVLERCGIRTAGAGRNLREASAPAVLPLSEKRRVLLHAFGCGSAGIPGSWAATAEGPGINRLPNLSLATARRVAREILPMRNPADVVVASIHWGGNWGYEVGGEEIAFAHVLIDEAGVDVVHGHSSHHPRPIEIYRGKPVLYGCGDFLNDYEGIEGYERFRGDLTLMYLVTFDAARGTLAGLEMIPFRIRKFRLGRADRTDSAWLCDTLTREGRRFGTRVHLSAEHTLSLAW